MQSLKQDDEKWGIGQEERLKPGGQLWEVTKYIYSSTPVHCNHRFEAEIKILCNV